MNDVSNIYYTAITLSFATRGVYTSSSAEKNVVD